MKLASRRRNLESVRKGFDRSPLLPEKAMNDDATVAYLFRCDDSDLFAITTDEAGRNLPKQIGFGGWHFEMEFPLGVQEPMPKALKPVLRGLRYVGYYIWREGEARNPSGTSQ
jgi:hypothetical protein